MKYATVEDYRRISGDCETTDGEVEKYLVRASAKAEELTFGRLRALSENRALTPFQKDCVRDFVCFQAEFLRDNGSGEDIDVSSYTVGSISVSVGTGKQEAELLHVSSAALSFLDRSGLRWRGA